MSLLSKSHSRGGYCICSFNCSRNRVGHAAWSEPSSDEPRESLHFEQVRVQAFPLRCRPEVCASPRRLDELEIVPSPRP